MSSGGAPRRVRLRVAARCKRRKSSSNSSTPRSMGSAPPATHVRLASSPIPKSGESLRTPPPA
eukprot:5992694-Pleurochrysis_carterae.AAC.1